MITPDLAALKCSRHRLHPARPGDADLQRRQQRPQPDRHGRDHARRLSGRSTLDAEEVPLKICGVPHCYRTEAASLRCASRGSIRVHQFTKVEMFAFTLPEQRTRCSTERFATGAASSTGLGIAYRVVDTATGDLGGR